GLGRALIGWAGEALRQRGAARLFLDVSTANTAARALYTASGFAEIAHRRRYYADGSDAVIMVLDL
ncbi:MAG: alanine acetyltransferase, partial [Rhodospirillaceae bacterium BRH_c57]